MYTASLPLALSQDGMPDPTIGLLVGVSALVQIPAAFAGGSLLDRFGGVRLFRVGAVMYLLASSIMLVPVVAAGESVPAIVVVRFLQGVGLALCLPAALSLVPRLIEAARRGLGLSFIGGAQNLALLVFPPLSLVILRGSSLSGVALVAIGFVLVAIVLVVRLPFRTGAAVAAEDAAEAASGLPPAGRRFGFAYRPSWGPLLLVTLLYVAHWGVVTAYLPQRAAAAGADVGLFFVADGLGIVLVRVPSGWLADRIAARWLMATGLLMTAFALVLLLPAADDDPSRRFRHRRRARRRARPHPDPARAVTTQRGRRPGQRLLALLGRPGRSDLARQHRRRPDHGGGRLRRGPGDRDRRDPGGRRDHDARPGPRSPAGEPPPGDRPAYHPGMSRIVVTGGSGKAGRWVVGDLRGRGHDVLNVDLVRDGSAHGLCIVTDLTDLGQCHDVIAGADAVVHLAAIPAPELRPAGETFRVNAMSTYNVFAAALAHGVRRVVWASSETVLGLPFDPHPPLFAPIDETIEPRPESSYGWPSSWARRWPARPAVGAGSRSWVSGSRTSWNPRTTPPSRATGTIRGSGSGTCGAMSTCATSPRPSVAGSRPTSMGRTSASWPPRTR